MALTIFDPFIVWAIKVPFTCLIPVLYINPKVCVGDVRVIIKQINLLAQATKRKW